MIETMNEEYGVALDAKGKVEAIRKFHVGQTVFVEKSKVPTVDWNLDVRDARYRSSLGRRATVISVTDNLVTVRYTPFAFGADTVLGGWCESFAIWEINALRTA